MTASISQIIDAKKFPLGKIRGVLLGHPTKIHPSDIEKIRGGKEYRDWLTPVFSIENKWYIPKVFNYTERPPYPGMKENYVDIFPKLTNVKYTTIPIQLEEINERVYGLIEWIKDAHTVGDDKSEILSNQDFNQIIECAMELSKYQVFHLDLHAGNIIKKDRIYFVDPTLATEHFRPKGDYANDRAPTYHWPPEILQGGLITEKSSVYSLGRSLESKFPKSENKLKNIWKSCQEEKPNNRPSFQEIESFLN